MSQSQESSFGNTFIKAIMGASLILFLAYISTLFGVSPFTAKQISFWGIVAFSALLAIWDFLIVPYRLRAEAKE